MNKNIIVVGANQTGLVFAAFARNAGFDVTVYEAKKQCDVAYDWTDDMVEETFEEVGMPLPPKEIYTRKRNWTFVPPEKGVNVLMDLPDDQLDMAIYRRPFNAWLLSRAECAGVKVFYETPVKRAIVENDVVLGVELENGEIVPAGLVVDCGGVNSAVRKSLPESLKITRNIDKNDTFIVRRTFFNRPENTARPKYTNRAYLKHINERGISWCTLSHDEKQADVLIGRVGEMSDKTYENALADIRRDNEIVGDKIVTGGQLLQIPVRHPLSRFVANGYALLGDSACMTIPMLGSGMASGMKAGKMLSDVISPPIGENPFSVENLYRYQARFMKEIGGKHAAVDMMKNWLLNSKKGDVDFLLGKGVVSRKVLIEASAGHMIVMSPAEMAQAAVKGVAKLPLLLNLAVLLQKMKKECKTASNMPKHYDEAAFSKWEEKYEKPFRK